MIKKMKSVVKNLPSFNDKPPVTFKEQSELFANKHTESRKKGLFPTYVMR